MLRLTLASISRRLVDSTSELAPDIRQQQRSGLVGQPHEALSFLDPDGPLAVSAHRPLEGLSQAAT
jgi:hypothetical protein